MRKKILKTFPITGKKTNYTKEGNINIDAMYNNVCDVIVNIPTLLDEICSSFVKAKEQAKIMREYIHSYQVVDLTTERELINIDSALDETAENIKLALQDLINTKDNV